MVLIDGFGHHPTLHPLEQVRRYCEYLIDFMPVLQDDDHAVAGVAYLHNATEHGAAALRDFAEVDHARMFLGKRAQRRSAFLDYLRSRLSPDAPGAPYADAFLNSRAAPSRQLLAVASSEIREREQFILLDEQQLAYNLVLHATEAARAE